LLTSKHLTQETGLRFTGPRSRIPLSLGLDQPLTGFTQLLLKVPEHVGQMLELSMSTIINGWASGAEQIGRKLDQDLAKVATTAGQVAALGTCPERFLVQA
jgi:hypothetical protein